MSFAEGRGLAEEMRGVSRQGSRLGRRGGGCDFLVVEAQEKVC